MSWYTAAELVSGHVVKIMTPQGSGTGMLLHRDGDFCAVATAAHVVEQAHLWESPIRLWHVSSGGSLLLHEAKRAIALDKERDSAVIAFIRGDIDFPTKTLDLIAEGKSVKVGVEVGWLGFPAVASETMCFFSGRISARAPGDRYLIDGVAINGVSGGPAFHIYDAKTIHVLGIMSAYIPNRATGDTLPGLCVATGVGQCQEAVKQFKSVDEAKKSESAHAPAGVEPKAEPKAEPKSEPKTEPKAEVKPSTGTGGSGA